MIVETNTIMDEETPETQSSDAEDESSNRVQRAAELCFGTSTVIVGLALEGFGAVPYQRPLPVQPAQNGGFVLNLAYTELYNGETVPDLHLIIIVVLVPLIIQLWLARKAGGRNAGGFERHNILCVYLTAVGLTVTLTNFIKLYAGCLRPIFLEVCEPDETYASCTSGNDRKMRLSFPSGHASLSFCCLCVFSFYLEKCFGMSAARVLILDKQSGEIVRTYRQNSRFTRIISILCYSPIVIAIFIATSRVHDNVHFPADIVGGALLGGSVAHLVHQTWFELQSTPASLVVPT